MFKSVLSAVIFDFDGIIVDSESLHHRAFNTVLAPHGIQIEWSDYQKTFIGLDDRDALKTAFKQARKSLSGSRRKELIAEKTAVFQSLIERQANVFPGAIELIKSIPARLPVGLCSGSLRSDIEPVISAHGIKNIFRTIVTAEDTGSSKPDPAPYRLALKNLGVENPASAVAIEDTPAGILSAQRAGLKVLAVANSYNPKALAEADAITDTLENITRKTLEDLVL